ncbi:ranBP-type and C3HC4-type zinc finger-containing protein 1-like isoform X2 [Anneissia japonica]|nr:ranBP-type and C3HC4-type zinc finger-containing protein 1-like isoform X2 [Anneissia japonica]
MARNQQQLGTQSQEKGELIDSLINEFVVCVHDGDVARAGEIAQQLAENKVPLAVSQDANMTDVSKNDNPINLRISVEDRYDSSAKITLSVKPSITFKTLKEKMYKLYGFPPKAQRWIVEKRIMRDQETLKSVHIDTSGFMVYLYLVSANTAAVKKDEAERKPSENQEVYVDRLPDDLPSPGGAGVPYMGAAAAGPPPARQSGRPQAKTPPVKMEDARRFVHQYMDNPLLVSSAPSTKKKTALEVGWNCNSCTMINAPRRPSCHMCTLPRPDDYVLPPVGSYVLDPVEKRLIDEEEQHQDVLRQIEEEERQLAVLNFERLQEYDQMDLIPNSEPFTCLICYDDYGAEEGVTLRECLHSFCRECLTGHISTNEEPEIRCPYMDENFACDALIQDREIRALVDDEQYQKHLQRCLSTAETQAANSFHCKTVNCHGWCIYEDDVNFFPCPICKKKNCLTCKAIHEGMNCKEYQDSLRADAANDQAARQTQMMLDELVRKGDAMHCPKCKIIVQKKDGCDWVRCTMCKTEICWVTKGPRWGPNGKGDRSGGCHCRENGQLCRPNCQNCH